LTIAICRSTLTKLKLLRISEMSVSPESSEFQQPEPADFQTVATREANTSHLSLVTDTPETFPDQFTVQPAVEPMRGRPTYSTNGRFDTPPAARGNNKDWITGSNRSGLDAIARLMDQM
jgi:hypothetical protein